MSEAVQFTRDACNSELLSELARAVCRERAGQEIANRYVSTTLIQPGSEFKLGFSGSPSVADWKLLR